MRFTYYHQFEDLNDSVALVIDYDYEPAERQTQEYPGCAENAVISGVQLNINGVYSDIGSLTDDCLDELLVEACIEHWHQGEE